MHIVTPAEIESVAWEGELAAPETSQLFGPTPPKPPVVTIGQPEIWPAAEALENEVGQKWVPPMGDASYWLLRLACTLHKPPGLMAITEAQQTLSLRPQSDQAAGSTAYAHSLFPDRLSVEDKAEFSISLLPEIKFAGGSEFKAGQLGARIDYRKVFPVIQSYGLGESDPYWIFKRHAQYPLEGSQFVYAVVVAKAGAEGIRAYVDLTVMTETKLGPLRFGMSQEAKADTRFVVP
jgi:hypothetical protein